MNLRILVPISMALLMLARGVPAGDIAKTSYCGDEEAHATIKARNVGLAADGMSMRVAGDFEGEFVVLDSDTDACLRLRSGMTKKQVESAATKAHVKIVRKTADEWSVGTQSGRFGFVEGKLKRVTNF